MEDALPRGWAAKLALLSESDIKSATADGSYTYVVISKATLSHAVLVGALALTGVDLHPTHINSRPVRSGTVLLFPVGEVIPSQIFLALANYDVKDVGDIINIAVAPSSTKATTTSTETTQAATTSTETTEAATTSTVTTQAAPRLKFRRQSSATGNGNGSAKHEITTIGSNIPKPCEIFDEAFFPSDVLNEVAAAGFKTPTPILCSERPLTFSDVAAGFVSLVSSSKHDERIESEETDEMQYSQEPMTSGWSQRQQQRGVTLEAKNFALVTDADAQPTSLDAETGGQERANESILNYCPVCFENMLTSPEPLAKTACGHYLHFKCHQAYIQTSYQCPTCLKSLADMTDYFRQIDIALAFEERPEWYSNFMNYIYCYECAFVLTIDFQITYNKCAFCFGYNTVVLGTLKLKQVGANIYAASPVDLATVLGVGDEEGEGGERKEVIGDQERDVMKVQQAVEETKAFEEAFGYDVYEKKMDAEKKKKEKVVETDAECTATSSAGSVNTLVEATPQNDAPKPLASATAFRLAALTPAQSSSLKPNQKSTAACPAGTVNALVEAGPQNDAPKPPASATAFSLAALTPAQSSSLKPKQRSTHKRPNRSLAYRSTHAPERQAERVVTSTFSLEDFPYGGVEDDYGGSGGGGLIGLVTGPTATRNHELEA
ncbi:hypothetical protein HDV00_000325 [Rhizophlyctis rosea]|nr:hypothetical protein HDV00_000325 [Rhizophlyctis rosea]